MLIGNNGWEVQRHWEFKSSHNWAFICMYATMRVCECADINHVAPVLILIRNSPGLTTLFHCWRKQSAGEYLFFVVASLGVGWSGTWECFCVDLYLFPCKRFILNMFLATKRTALPMPRYPRRATEVKNVFGHGCPCSLSGNYTKS